MPFDAVVELSSLDGTTGFRINGEATYDNSGFSVASAGDVNGDGIDDLIIGAFGADPNGANSGAIYVVFGRTTGFAANLNLSTLDGTTGFQISGEGNYDQSGYSVASAGDVNGDGIDDLIIGAHGADPNGNGSGASYVVFGRTTGFAANLDLSTLDGTNGFQINGAGSYDYSGRSVASAGDVNGDGVDDLIIGAENADPNGSGSGASYVVFGRTTGFAANLDLSTLDGTTGFQINGVGSYDYSGRSVASAGDVNGDGIDDLIIGAWRADPNGDYSYSGASYVVFGRTTGFAATLNLSALDGTTGFKMSGDAAGDFSGFSVASAGDVNGDGVDDLIIGARNADPNGSFSGASYVVFGRTTGFSANLNLSTLDGTTGFKINGEAFYAFSGRSVASAGDVNGDGIDDLIIGANQSGNGSSAGYVVFGRTTGFAASLDLSTLDGTTGFQINGEVDGDNSGGSVASAGDVNGDGIDDLIIGAFAASPNGFSSGASYVIFGRPSSVNFAGTAGDDVRSGAGTNDSLSGQGGNDTLNGLDGDDTLDGGDGDDLLTGGAGNDSLTGGQGRDTASYSAAASAVTVSLATGAASRGAGTDSLSSIEDIIGSAFDDILTGDGGDNSLTGGLGRDLLSGGGGQDTARYDTAAAGVRVNLATTTAQTTGGAGVDTLAGIENLLGSAFADNLTGNGLANILEGGDGADSLAGGAGSDLLLGGLGKDLLDGGSGADTLQGGAGDDTYVVDTAGDTVIELDGEGTDTVNSSVDFTLSATLERLILTGSAAVNATGNEGNNSLVGNAGANTLSGGGGNDILTAGAGNDLLIGGAGNDFLTGGTGADRFVITQSSIGLSSLGGVKDVDSVYDLSFALGDRLDLSGIDANANLANDQAFQFVTSFTRTAGEATLILQGSTTVLRLDVDGDGKADYQMNIYTPVDRTISSGPDFGGWIL